MYTSSYGIHVLATCSTHLLGDGRSLVEFYAIHDVHGTYQITSTFIFYLLYLPFIQTYFLSSIYNGAKDGTLFMRCIAALLWMLRPFHGFEMRDAIVR